MTVTAQPVTAQPLATTRRRMPQRRQGYTASVSISGADFYVIANPNDDGTLGEVFITFGKQDSTLRQLTETGSLR
jgi:ribonucleoside-diphosphate reductase alpha chain